MSGQKKPQGRGNGAGAHRNHNCRRQFTGEDRSTATQAQVERLLKLLKVRPRHTHELRRHGISHPAARVLDLKRRGFVIGVSRVNTVDSDSFTHVRVALYSLANGGSR